MPHSADSSKQQMVPMRWCIFVDILGFSQLWESVAAVSTSPEGRPRKLKLAPVKGCW